MKTLKQLSIMIALLLLAGCALPVDRDVETIHPSDVIISEDRPVSGFTGIEFSTFGLVNISQGTEESLTITGSDNILPLVITEVSNGKLIIRTEENYIFSEVNSENVLTFNITVIDLNELTNSGAGQFNIDRLTTDSLDFTISGAGNINITGEANRSAIEISGAGSIIAPDFQITSADVVISGVGSAEVWVTDRLTGNISGAGNVRYYGDPEVDTESSGLGKFVSLGTK